jgi:hypothetical protein
MAGYLSKGAFDPELVALLLGWGPPPPAQDESLNVAPSRDLLPKGHDGASASSLRWLLPPDPFVEDPALRLPQERGKTLNRSEVRCIPPGPGTPKARLLSPAEPGVEGARFAFGTGAGLPLRRGQLLA